MVVEAITRFLKRNWVDSYKHFKIETRFYC